MAPADITLGQGELSREILAAANIHPETGLATDYLNHFNEVVMLIEMLPDMPECVDDILAWQPASYEEHFHHTGFVAKDLAIKAYSAVPVDLKSHFEEVIDQLNQEIGKTQDMICSDDPDRLEKAMEFTRSDIQPLLQAAGGAIHGRMEDVQPESQSDTQDSIDALFD